ncbi:MAG TPA: NAD(P)/FAD-dependent oxidoreductase [Acidimicrobiia bacterium]|nr:NAD(P)/FAD-dependent oxidoreductase [Acidimicrobiia bacterium]
MTYDYDVIVVGGRVAGASTAMLLARQGHRVLIVERAAMPSDTISTHAILRTGVLQLRKWGVLDRIVDAGTPPIRDITLGFGEERIAFQVRPDHGIDTLFAPRRFVLDAILVDAAREAGAELVDRTVMSDLLRDGSGRIHGIRVGRGASARSITSRYVVGADGYRSRVADLAGSTVRRSHPATNAINYGYYEGVDVSGFWFQFTPGVNAGLIPTNDDQVLVFTGRPAHLRRRFAEDPDSEFMRLIEQGGPDLAGRVRSGKRVGRFHGTNGLPGFIRQAWGPGWALVGDAGFTKDPISAHGISDALRDAELCARAVDRSLRSPEQAIESMRTYETLRDSLSLRMFEESRQLARFEWAPEEASRRMRVISEEVRRECDVLVSLPGWDDAGALVGAAAHRAG